MNTSVNLNNNGYNESVDVATAKTLAATDCGTVQNATASLTFTLPAAAAGLEYLVRIADHSLTVVITPNGTDTTAGMGFTAANKSLHLTNADAGAHLKLTGAAGGWTITACDLGGSDSTVLTQS